MFVGTMCIISLRHTVPFQPSIQSRVTNDFELSTSGVLSRVTCHHEHLPVSIFAKFWPILLTNEWFWCLSQPKFGSWTPYGSVHDVTHHTLWTVGRNGTVSNGTFLIENAHNFSLVSLDRKGLTTKRKSRQWLTFNSDMRHGGISRKGSKCSKLKNCLYWTNAK